MAGQKNGLTYFRDLATPPPSGDIVAGHKALFTMEEGIYVMDSVGSVSRLDEYQLIQDVSAALSVSISAHSATVYRGIQALNTSDYIYTISHGDASVPDTTPLVTISAPSDTSVLCIAAVRNRTSTSFDVILSDVPSEPGYNLNWLLIGDILMGSGNPTSGGPAGNPDLLGSGTVVITAQQSIIPSTSGTFSLGSEERPWKDIHVSGNTIYLGGRAVSISGTEMLLDDRFIVTSETPSSADASIFLTTETFSATASHLQSQVDTLDASASSLQSQVSDIQSITGSIGSGLFVPISGGTMTGGLTTPTLSVSTSANFSVLPYVAGVQMGNMSQTSYTIQSGSFTPPATSNPGDVVYVI